MCQSEGNHQIVMAFWPPVLDCLLKKGGVGGGSLAPIDPPKDGHPRNPLATPLLYH